MALDPLLFLSVLPALQEIRVHEAVRGCFGGNERNDTWTVQGDAFVLGQRRVPIQTVESIRRLVLAGSEGPLDANGLLASVGVTPTSLVEHRDEILG